MRVRNAVTTLETLSTPYTNDDEEEKLEAKLTYNQEDDDEKLEHEKSSKSDSTIPTGNVKNIDPQYHSRNQESHCKICRVPVGKCLQVSHYVNVHPKSEVFPSRVAPDVGDLLRKLKDVPKCEEIKKSVRGRHIYRQFCYFCNESMWFPKYLWIKHMIGHSGYYTHKCTDCSKKFPSIPFKHKCKDKCNIQEIKQLQFDKVDHNLMAYLCNLCNYVRFHEKDIQKHLHCEHEEDSNKYQEVIFLSFAGSANKRKEKQKTPEESHEEEISESAKGEYISFR